MAKNVTVKILGGESKTLEEVATVGDAAFAAGGEGYTATVNGVTADAAQPLRDFDFIALAPQVKGGVN